MSEKKLGRPSENPKLHKISVRINDRCKEILDNYCDKHGVSKTEAIDRGIRTLEKDADK